MCRPLELEGATWFFSEGEEEERPPKVESVRLWRFLGWVVLYRSASLESVIAFGKETCGKRWEKFFSLIKKRSAREETYNSFARYGTRGETEKV